MMQTLTLMMMTILSSARGDQNLFCQNDFFNKFFCVWNSSRVGPETKCWLNITITYTKSSYSRNNVMSVDPAQPQLRSASVEFSSSIGVVTTKAKLHQEVRCDNYSGPVSMITPHSCRDSVVKVSPPHTVKVDGLRVSWVFKGPRVQIPMFQLEYRSTAQRWTDVKCVQINSSYLELSEDHLQLHQDYIVRVRAKLPLRRAVWSDWSDEYTWRSDVGQTAFTTPGLPPGVEWSSPAAGIFLPVLLVVFMILTPIVMWSRKRWTKKNTFFYIPDPSKFFGDLNSQHGGNFVSWLGPCESFIKVDTEFLSPVEVLKLQDACDSRDTHRNSAALLDSTDGTAKSSNYSNSTYFLSQSSKGPGDVLEPCSADSSYGPAGGASGPQPLPQHSAAQEPDGARELDLSLKRLEKLRQDTQSPDSGFAGGAEDSMEETELPSPLPLNLPLHLKQDLHAPHPIMRPLLGFEHAASRLAPSDVIPVLDLDLQSASGMIEPSSGDYMPVKSVQNEY